MAGFTLNNQICQPSSCNSTNNCIACPFGSVLINQNTPQVVNTSCSVCNQSSNCARCLPTSITTCTSCLTGYYLNYQSVCILCPSGCGSCLSLNSCFSCLSGYIPQLPGTLITPQSAAFSSSISSINYQIINCIKCVSPCITCINSPSTCLSCASGYSYINYLCISDFNFAVFVSLTANAQVFNQNYFSFLQAIANSINSAITNLTINSITYSSTNINLQVSTFAIPGSSLANQQQQ